MGFSYLSLCATIIVHVHVLQCIYCSSHAIDVTGSFIEPPSPVAIEVIEMDAVFRCRHQRIEADISWMMNGLSSKVYRDVVDGFILDNNDTRVETLTIPAIPKYNGTEVVCVATVFEESLREVTPPANLIIIVTRKTATQPPPTTATELVTREATNQPHTPTTMEPDTADFEITPSPLTVAVEQGTATFQCQHQLAIAIGWRVNEIPLLKIPDSLNLSITSATTHNGIAILLIGNLLENNGTTVECIATLIDGSSPIILLSSPVLLLVQDTPNRVKNATLLRDYSEFELMTLWNPLPTLDITGTDPDILYTVELYQITCGQNILINRTEVAGSNVTEEDLDLMQIYKAVIAARNNVRGARNGPSAQIKEKFMSLNGTTLFNLTRNFRINIQSGAPVPSYYEMILQSLDGLNSNLLINITVQRNGEMIDVYIEESVPPKSLWRASILAYGCESDRIVTDYELSTHDIQNVLASSQLPGQISVTGELISGATATGVLVVVYSLNNSNDMHYIAKQIEGTSIRLNVTGLTGAEYGVSIFGLENGLPFPGVVASPKNIAIQNSYPDKAPLVGYELIVTNSSHVCIMCTFPMDSSATDCVAVVHQRISQLNSSGLMNIESSHKFTGSDDTAYGCIEGVNLEQYQIGVVGGKVVTSTIQSNDIGSSQSGAIAGTVLAITAFTLIVMMVIGIVYYYFRKLGPLYSEVGIAPSRIQSDTVVNIEDDSGFHHYAESAVPLREEETEGESAEEELPPLSPGLEESLVAPPLPPRSEESMILVEDQLLDSARSPLETIKESDGPPPPPPPPPPPRGPPDEDSSKDGFSDPTYAQPEQSTRKVAVPPPGPPDEDTSKDGSSDATYAQPELTRKVAVPPPAATERLVYDDIHGFQNKEGQTYAMTQLPASKKVVDDLHKVVYSEIQPKTGGEATSTEPVCTAEQTCETGTPPPPRDSSAADLFFSRLLPYASKWQSLGLALSLDDDRLDEIYTNNETDEACLQEMLELYMMRSDRNHSWEEIEAALKRIGNGFQESDSESLTISPMIHVHGSTTFSSDVTTNPQHRSPSHNILNMHDAKTRYNQGTSAIPGRRWSSLPVISAEVADSEEYGVDYDFKSEHNIPYSQGSFTSDDNPQCTVAYNLKEELTVSTTDIDDVDRWDKLASSSPSFLGGHCYCIGSFIINEGYEELELFDTDQELQLHVSTCIPQESYLELTEYDRALIKQLGLGRRNPSSRNHCQESSEELNIDVHAATASRLVPQSRLNTTSSSQGMLSSLEKLPVHKAKYSSQELQLVTQGTEPTANYKLWTIWKQVSECLDVRSQVCSLLRKSACNMLQSFSSFMPLEYPT